MRLLEIIDQLDGRMQTNDGEISRYLKAEIMGVHDQSINSVSSIEAKYNNMLDLIAKLGEQTQQTANKSESLD